MNRAEPSDECEEDGPDSDEEGDNKDENLPVLERAIPQEGPVLSIRLGEELEIDDAIFDSTYSAQPIIA